MLVAAEVVAIFNDKRGPGVLAREFKVSSKTIRNIQTGRTWGRVTNPEGFQAKRSGRPLGSRDKNPRFFFKRHCSGLITKKPSVSIHDAAVLKKSIQEEEEECWNDTTTKKKCCCYPSIHACEEEEEEEERWHDPEEDWIVPPDATTWLQVFE